ncbi:DNA-deoxyinosine glycosylase [Sphingomonas sp. PB2P19]|uniref:DNA-deoxyinosine glycosylase n=1 Tax=Sphingomonas rhamnosi TaxID=3096156 RepID=UPI002FC7D905
MLKRSFAPVVAPNTRLLVLGSLPGDRSLAEARYYAHPQNQFWRLMSPVAGFDLTALAYDDRLAALLACGVGLWDVVATARRTGSSDAAIRDIAGNDIAALAASLPQLQAIGFNGATAAKQGRRLLDDTRLALIDLPSSSPLHTIGLAAKQPAWDRLRTVL